MVCRKNTQLSQKWLVKRILEQGQPIVVVI